MNTNPSRIFIFIIIILIGLSSFIFYKYQTLKKESSLNRTNFEATSKDLQNVVIELQTHLSSSTAQNRNLDDFLTILKARNSDFQNDLLEKDQKVQLLTKLVQTDPELLRKYSKVYFLNENYIPTELSLIDAQFLFRQNPSLQIHTKIKPYLEALIRDARAENINLSVLSAYRSYDVQKSIKSKYTVIYGADSTNRFSADQGYSEHQLGTTVDLTTKKGGAVLDGFEKTPAYPWLLTNAQKYGFILSYPANNAFYLFEPWHWRFVGVALATSLHTANKHFYDLQQRELDPFLLKIFD